MRANIKMKTNKFERIMKNLVILGMIIISIISFSYADGLASPPSAVSDPVVTPPLKISSPSSGAGSISITGCEGLFANGLDPTRNLMSSIISLCLPGILINLDRLEQNQCEKILCEYDMAQKGLTPVLCAKEAAYNTCLITGEGYDVIEGILIGSLRQNIRQILENPLGLGIQFLKGQAEKSVLACRPEGITCNLPQKISSVFLAGLNVADAIGKIQSLMSQFEGLLGDEEQKTACEQLEDIRPELEEIVNQYYEANGR